MNINSSLYPHYVNIHGVLQCYVIGTTMFIILPITTIVHKYPNIHYTFYADDLYMYMSFPSSSDSDLIKMYMFNCITAITEWVYHNYLSIHIKKYIIII